MLHLVDVKIKKIQAIYKVDFEEKTITQHANRKVNTLVICLQGSCVLQQGRRKRVVDNTYIGIMPSETRYKIVAEDGTKCIFVEFYGTRIPMDRPDSFALKNIEEIRTLAKEVEYNWSVKSTGYELFAYEKVYQILRMIGLEMEESFLLSKKVNLIAPSIAYMQEHYDDFELSNEMLANQSDISVVYFRKIFTSAFGVPPMKFVQKIRMDKAKELLQSGMVKVTDVARLTGFSSIYSFSKTFKTVCGCAPTRYLPKEER